MSGNDRQRADDLARENATLRADLAARDTHIEALRAEVSALREQRPAPTPAGDLAWVLRTRLAHNGVDYPAGAEMPFDPLDPPAGCDGLREGIHYERLRVLRAPPAHA